MDKFFEKISILSFLGMYLLVNISLEVCFRLGVIKQIFFRDNNLQHIIGNLLLVIWIIFRMKKQGFSLKESVNDFKYKNNWKESFKILVINIGLSLGGVFLISFLVYKINPSFFQEIMSQNSLELNGTTLSSIYEFILAVCLAPIIEELVFRGIFFNRLKKRWNATAGIIISSIIFGSLHIELSIFGAIFFGAMMCVVYMKTKNILVTMSIHCMNNLLCFLATLSGGNSEQGLNVSEIVIMGKVGIVIVVIFGIVTIRYLIKNWPNSKKIINQKTVKIN